jgi:membrane-bound serine protease (ClpP class)
VISEVNRTGVFDQIRRLLFGAIIVALLGTLAPPRTSAETPRIYAIHVSGVISSLTSSKVIETLRTAERNHATALLLVIDSPGGTETAVQEITRAFLSATVPVIVYVDGDPKAEALSGALFITLAGNVAAVGPDAKIGAGNPESLRVNPSTNEQQQHLSQTVQFATNIAAARKRNVTALTAVITNNDALTADEALAQGLVDKIAPNIEGLLTQVNGQQVQTLAGPATIQSENARIVWQKSSWHARILQQITDPNVAYLLFSLGGLLLIIELFNPGRLIAGVPAIIALAAAFVAFGNMPVSWFAVVLMVVAFLFLIRELFTPKFTPLGPLGIILYLVGSYTLYRPVRETSAIVPAVGVTWWVIAASTVVICVAMVIMIRLSARARGQGLPPYTATLVGTDAIVSKALRPRGQVRLHGQEWPAISDGPDVAEGERVQIASIRANVLHVMPYEEEFQPAVETSPLQMSDRGKSAGT